MKKLHRLQTGFTLVELMIASMIFTVILLLVSSGLLQVGRMFYKGIVSSRTQEVARSITDEVAQAIQFSGEAVATGLSGSGNVKGLCAGQNRYSFLLNEELQGNTPRPGTVPYVLVVDQIPDCNNAGVEPQQLSGAVSPEGREMMAPNMRLTKLDVELVSGTLNLYNITVRVVYGEDDLLEDPDDPDTWCQIEQAGSQFCAVSEFETTVERRI